ncbi:MAG: hypothetical protein LPJ91_03755 [Pseudazoarcus pumilus]|nr:hypothetical protein [Pseudazoarcus pumilus]
MRTLAEEALSRVMQYLVSAGISPTPDVMREALQLVSEVLDEASPVAEPDAPMLFARIMDLLPERFSLPDPLLPPASPPLERGSIHYGAR